jgi:cytochrome oxidase assembly protein ShyY1
MRLTKKWWFVIVVLPVIGLCVKAGFWQLDRAQQKEQLIERLTVGESAIVDAVGLTHGEPGQCDLSRHPAGHDRP